jgi:hypothetical protein
MERTQTWVQLETTGRCKRSRGTISKKKRSPGKPLHFFGTYSIQTELICNQQPTRPSPVKQPALKSSKQYQHKESYLAYELRQRYMHHRVKSSWEGQGNHTLCPLREIEQWNSSAKTEQIYRDMNKIILKLRISATGGGANKLEPRRLRIGSTDERNEEGMGRSGGAHHGCELGLGRRAPSLRAPPPPASSSVRRRRDDKEWEEARGGEMAYIYCHGVGF